MKTRLACALTLFMVGCSGEEDTGTPAGAGGKSLVDAGATGGSGGLDAGHGGSSGAHEEGGTDAPPEVGQDSGTCCAPGATRACGTEGTQTCQSDCSWSECACEGPGSQACNCDGSTGTQTRDCGAGAKWSDWSECSCAEPYTDISSGQGTNSGWNPSTVIDANNGKILVVTENRSMGKTPWLFRCELDGTGCTAKALSNNTNGDTPAAVIDTNANRLLVVGSMLDMYSGKHLPILFRCALDGSGCTEQALLSVQSANALNPSVALANGKLFVAAVNGTGAWKPVLLACSTDGNLCDGYDISAGQGQFSGSNPSLVIDTVNAKTLVATTNGANANKPGLFRCNLDGSDCTHIDISAGAGVGSGGFPSATIDTANSKLLVAAQNASKMNKASLFRCNLDGTGCTHHDVSGGQPDGSCWNPRAIVDSAGNQLLVAMTNELNKPSLVRCNLDGTACVHLDISAGQPAQSGMQISAALDAKNHRLVVGANNAANDFKPALYIAGL